MPWIDPTHWERDLLHDTLPGEPRDGVAVPASDCAAWEHNPRHRLIYDKLWLHERLRQPCGPSGTEPSGRALIIKPITNLWGMGWGAYRFSPGQDRRYNPGCFWSLPAEGAHLSIDIAVYKGAPLDWWVTLCTPHETQFAAFSAFWLMRQADWLGRDEYESGISAALKLVDACLPGYTGMVNVETIGDQVIDAHLRFTTQWADLYGPRWLRAVIDLYAGHPESIERLPDEPTGYSVPVLLPGRPVIRPHAAKLLNALLRATGEDMRAHCVSEDDIGPPGLRRIAVVNGRDLAECWTLARKMEAAARTVEPPPAVAEPAR